ncbi:hypothetical protein BDZ94DRAFT_1254388 [Collybia nuda]|uniref:Uncharacterized protein n=1 Tax=Collybia nuda TaxID=64659 RepID=A0A9P5YAX4_9AGAR|nr:hypothetical protein BDZ94DRAFT_1254388 [Collybia nuda]
MLWCLPQLQFSRKRKRAVPPPPPAKEEMHMHPQDTASESGMFYLVPNKYGQGKTIVRRPLPPPTSAPLDDDFDAFTQAGTTTRGPATEWEVRNRGSDIVGSSSPLDDNFDALTFTPGARSSVMIPESSNRAQNRTRPQSSGLTSRYGRAEPNEGFEDYGEYGQYMNEMEKMFGGNDADLKLSVRQLHGQDQERSESRQIARLSNTRAGGAGRGAIGRIGRPSKLGSIGRSMDVVGPRAGQAYEVVDHRVLEDGPERTVTISTWREQVANEAGSEEGIDVYYVGADEYAVESAAGDEVKTELGGYDNRRRVTPPRFSQKPNGSSPGSSGEKTDPARGVRTSPEVRLLCHRNPMFLTL